MKTIYLLIGQKGSGKSYIGSLLEKQYNICFLRVEDWVKTLNDVRNTDDESYLRKVFQTIEMGVRSELEYTDTVSFESTGLTKYFDQMLESLYVDFRVVTVKVIADPELCLKRVKSRDQSIHINISDNEVKSINEAVIAKNHKADFTLDNKNEKELIFELNKIITPQHSAKRQ